MYPLLAIYLTFAFAVGLACALVFTDRTLRHPKFVDGLESEGRTVAGILLGIAWPVVLVYWLVKNTPTGVLALGRGIAQVYRVLTPAPVAQLPRAQARVKEAS